MHKLMHTKKYFRFSFPFLTFGAPMTLGNRDCDE